MPKNPNHPHRLFKDRLKREGRDVEFTKLTKKLMAENGWQFYQADHEAMRQMGYEKENEKKLHAEWKRMEHRNAVEREQLKAREELNEQRRIEDYEEALSTLPSTSSIQVEMDWVGSHPAMYRKFKQRDPTKHVEIKANDILYTDVGKAPSRRAVNRLWYFANNPGKYFDPLMSEDKKKSEDGANSEGEQMDVGLEEVRRQLKSVQSRNE